MAFMAHAGGFVAGSVLMAVAYLINPKMMNEEYIEEDQDVPKIQTELAVIYDHLSKFRLNSALKSLDDFIQVNGITFELIKLRFNILKMQKDIKYKDEMSKLLSMQRLKNHELNQIHEIWVNNHADHDVLDENEMFTFAWTMANKHHFSTSEKLFEQLYSKQQKHESLSNLARKLSIIFDKRKDTSKKDKYAQIANELS